MKAATAHLAQVLRQSIRELGLSQREVEKRLGKARGYLSRVFAGLIDLSVDHVEEIAGILGVEPEELFRLAFPPSPAAPSHAVEYLRRKLASPAEPSRPAVSSGLEREIEQIVYRVLSRFLKPIPPSREPWE